MTYFSPQTMETIVIIDDQRLTIPDYMTINDIEYFINEKQIQSTWRVINEATYNTEQISPLDKAKQHYKDLGWFNGDRSK